MALGGSTPRFINETISPRKRRTQETGTISSLVPQSFGLIYQNNPVWLLALRPHFVKCVYVLGSISFVEFKSMLSLNILNKSLYHNVIELLNSNLFSFSSPPQDVVYLISGTVSFLNDKFLEFRKKKAIYVTESHTRLRR